MDRQVLYQEMISKHKLKPVNMKVLSHQTDWMLLDEGVTQEAHTLVELGSVEPGDEDEDLQACMNESNSIPGKDVHDPVDIDDQDSGDRQDNNENIDARIPVEVTIARTMRMVTRKSAWR
eukprot:6463879-Amphidinium_carterae.1